MVMLQTLMLVADCICLPLMMMTLWMLRLLTVMSIVCWCRSVSISQPLMKCKRVFQTLINIAVEELCETANSLVAPVRLGVARPTASFSLVSSNIDAVQVSTLNVTLSFIKSESYNFLVKNVTEVVSV